ncbi:DNA cytosine methyltransferase, partial [Mycobacterium tuberculosis]
HVSAAAARSLSIGEAFVQRSYKTPKKSTELQLWLHDKKLEGVCQHEARSHMASDLARYLFAASFAQSQGYS